jgi:hypothetical protein
MADKVRYPFGAADALSLTATGAQALSIDNQMTVVDGVTTEASGNRTINLTVNSLVKAGARILFKLKTNGTETTAFGTTMSGATLTGAAGKTKNVEFVYDGTNFVEAGTPVQID